MKNIALTTVPTIFKMSEGNSTHDPLYKYNINTDHVIHQTQEKLKP